MTQTANDELVLLTSYFNLAGGRRQDTADTFRVESSVPSHTSPDGIAALYIVTEASAGGHMGPRARRMAADGIAWEYQHHSDIPPAQRLKAALRAVHEQVLEEYDGHVSVGASVIAIEGNTIYLAQTPPSQVYVLHEGHLSSIAVAMDEGSAYSHALGSTAGPHISLFRDEIGVGDVLTLCSSWFARAAEPAEIRDCFGAGTADDIAEALLDLGKSGDSRDSTGIVIEAADPDDLPPEDEDEDIPGFLEQVDSAVQALASVGRMMWTELRAVPAEDEEENGDTGNGHGRRAAYPDAPDSALEPSPDVERSSARSPRAPGRRSLLGGLAGLSALAGSRPLKRERADRKRETETSDYEDFSDYVETRPAGDPTSVGHPPTSEDPYRVYREQATDEVEAVSPYPQTPDTFERDEDAEAEVPGSSAFHDQATAEIEIPVQQRTTETPVVRAEPPAEPEAPSTRRDHNESGAVPLDPVPADGSDEGPTERDTGVPIHETQRDSHSQRESGVRRSPIRQSNTTPEPEVPPEPLLASEISEVNARLGAGQDMAEVVPPVQAFPDTSTEPSRIYATSKDIEAANRRPRRFGGIARPVGGKDALEGPAVIRPGMGDIDLRRPVGRPAPPAAVWAAGVLFLLLIAVAGYLWYHHRHPAVAVNPYPALVRKDIRKANSAATPALQDVWLSRAQANLTKAQQNNDTPSDLRLLSTSLASTTDTLHKITRISAPTVVADFSKFPNARPSQIAASPGIVFVLDPGRKSVFAVTPNATSNPTQIVTAGETDTGFTFGNPVLIATDGATALVLDDKNVIVRDLAGNKSATSLTPGVPTPHYVEMESSDPDIYLLDTASSQVWRYPYGVSGFNPPPNQYFDTTKPALGNAVSFVYDGTSLYILRSDGSILKFDNQANPVKFSVNTRIPLNHPVAIYSDQGLKDLWIADPTNQRVVEIGKDGSYVRTYTSNAFASIKSMAVGPAGNTVFLLSGSKLLSFPVTH